MTTPDAPLPHAELLAAVRRANPNRMADSLRACQWRDVFEAHPDLRVLHDRDEAGGDPKNDSDLR